MATYFLRFNKLVRLRTEAIITLYFVLNSDPFMRSLEQICGKKRVKGDFAVFLTDVTLSN